MYTYSNINVFGLFCDSWAFAYQVIYKQIQWISEEILWLCDRIQLIPYKRVAAYGAYNHRIVAYNHRIVHYK